MAARPIRIVGLGAMLLAFTMIAAAPVLACSAPARPVAEIAREVDRIVLGTVRSVVGDGPWTYDIAVERVLKGADPGARWILTAGASDCGMPRLASGQRVVLELYESGRIAPGPWFFAWSIDASGGVVDASGFHEDRPGTLTALLALYARVMPDTSTAPVQPIADRSPASLLAILFATLVAITLLRRRPMSA